MSPEVDRTRFLREPTRRAIAELCRDEELSLAEIAAELGRDPGSLSQPKTMLKRGALILGTPHPPPDGRGGGRTYRFNDEWEEALEEARRDAASGPATESRDLLLIPLSDTEAACAVLAERVPPEVEWGARVHGAMSGLILASESERGTPRLISALGSAARGAVELHLSSIMTPAELRAWCAGGGAPARELPPGR
jgi:hypothetical protein